MEGPKDVYSEMNSRTTRTVHIATQPTGVHRKHKVWNKNNSEHQHTLADLHENTRVCGKSREVVFLISVHSLFCSQWLTLHLL